MGHSGIMLRNSRQGRVAVLLLSSSFWLPTSFRGEPSPPAVPHFYSREGGSVLPAWNLGHTRLLDMYSGEPLLIQSELL